MIPPSFPYSLINIENKGIREAGGGDIPLLLRELLKIWV